MLDIIVALILELSCFYIDPAGIKPGTSMDDTYKKRKYCILLRKKLVLMVSLVKIEFSAV